MIVTLDPASGSHHLWFRRCRLWAACHPRA